MFVAKPSRTNGPASFLGVAGPVFSFKFPTPAESANGALDVGVVDRACKISVDDPVRRGVELPAREISSGLEDAWVAAISSPVSDRLGL